MEITRLAPSPTGALHLGNARTFLINAALARQNGWRTVLRIEDLDGPRIKAGAADEAIADLRWLGVTWDTGPVYQSDRSADYAAAADRLIAQGDAYPCVCSRKEIDLAAAAPHAEDGSAVYPGTCRGRFASIQAAKQFAGRGPAIRFRVPAGTIEFDDAFAGPQSFEPATQLGDFVIRKNDGTAAYQLAVVVDDHAAGVTQVVRGDDLIDSTPRQMLLYAALGWADTIPRYTHLPLVLGEDGRRLAKRHGDTRLSSYRDAGVKAERVNALLARWSGIECGDEIGFEEWAARFRLDRLPHEPLTFTDQDDRWLK